MKQLLSRDYAMVVARALVDAGAVFAAPPGEPFVFRSGVRAPIKFDIERASAHTATRRTVITHLTAFAAPFLQETIPGIHKQFMTYAGVPDGGTLWAEALAQFFDGAHCLVEKVEGSFVPNIETSFHKMTVVVEDVITSGISSYAVVDAFRKIGYRARVVIAIVHYGFGEAQGLFAANRIDGGYLVNFGNLFDAMRESGQFSQTWLDEVLLWHDDPHAWSRRAQHAELGHRFTRV